MSRHIKPAVISVICDGCGEKAPPEPTPGALESIGWTISYADPSLCDWCPTCTRIRSDLETVIQTVRNIAQHHLQAGAAGAASGVWVAQEILAALDSE